MNFATIKNFDVANGTGCRVSLFVSGCTHYCEDCFNQEAWDFEYGIPFTSTTMDKLVAYLKYPQNRGLTILGGEPLHPRNADSVSYIVHDVREIFGEEKTIWVYSGYTLEELSERTDGVKDILQEIDVLVDGRFIKDLKDLNLKFRGSSNQRLIDMVKTREQKKIALLEA